MVFVAILLVLVAYIVLDRWWKHMNKVENALESERRERLENELIKLRDEELKLQAELNEMAIQPVEDRSESRFAAIKQRQDELTAELKRWQQKAAQ
jgi:hypothetical protein